MSATPAATIVVPVYNEAGNVDPLLRQLAEANGMNQLWQVLFMDDSPGNETEAAVRRAAATYNGSNLTVTVIHRRPAQQTGLATAVRDGLLAASSDNVVVMDGDLQHPPATVPVLLNTLNANGASIVMASRYMEGGNAAGLDGAARVVASRASTIAAQRLFPQTLKDVTDPMTGFFAVKRNQLEIAKMRTIRGFKVLLEVLVRHPHLEFAEVPLQFEERFDGQSKGSLKQGLEYLRHLAMLRLTTLPKPLNFALGGGGIAVFGWLLLAGLARLGLSLALANAVQLAVTWVLNFVYNYKVTWAGQPRSGLGRKMAWFAGTRAVTQVASWFGFAALTSHGLGHMASYWLCLLGATAINYATSDKLVFVESRKKLMTVQSLRQLVLRGAIAAAAVLGFVLVWRHLHLAVCLGLAAAALFCLVLASTETRWRGYSFWTPEAMDAFRWPEPVAACFAALRFHIVVPALHEAANIEATVDQFLLQDHPHFDVLVSLCSCDPETIAAARRAEAKHGSVVKLVISDHNQFPRHRKSYQVNAAVDTIPLHPKHHVVIADAEGGMQPTLLRHMEAVFNQEGCDVVQGGVQLMNLGSWRTWFQTFAAMEYKAWYEGNMARQSKTGVVLFGGNTIAFTRLHLHRIGGIPDSLTEDGAAGIRSAMVGAKVAVRYSAELCTRELSPPTMFNKQLGSLFYQRVRWVQGYFDELVAGHWCKLPTISQRVSAGYGLASPVMQSVSSILLPLAVLTVLMVKVPLLLALATFVPLAPYTLTVLAQGMHLGDFKRRFKQDVRFYHYLILVLMGPVYQIVLTSASTVAIWRQLRDQNDWYRTGREHSKAEIALTSVEGVLA